MKATIDQWLPQGSSIRNVLSLVWGASLGQVIIVLVSPLLTRIYTPEEFGVLAVYSSLLGILSGIAGFRYELAMPLPRTSGSAGNILLLSLLCVGLSSAGISILIFIFYEQIPLWVNTPLFASCLWLIPLGVFLNGVYQAFNYWAIRHQYFNRIALAKMQQGIGGAVAQVGFGFFQLGLLGLVLGHVIGQAAGMVNLIRVAYQKDLHILKRIRWKRIKRSARRYQRFPKYSTWASLANSSSTLLPILLFAMLFSSEVVGVYMLAHTTMHLPLRLIGNSVGQVFHAKAVEARHNGNLEHLFEETFISLLRISIVPFLVTVFFGPEIFSYVFGVDWTNAGVFAQFMAPWLVLQFCVSSVNQVVTIMEKQAGLLVSQVVFLMVRVSVIVVANYFLLGALELIACFAIASTFLYFGQFLWICSILKIDQNRIIKIFLNAFWLVKK